MTSFLLRKARADSIMNDMHEDKIIINKDVAIPQSELKFRFARSSGPGGQHVNRSATQVELIFDVANSPSLSDSQRHRVLQRLGTYLDSRGVLHIVAQSARSQYQNRQEAIARFSRLMHQALRLPKRRHPTRPTAASREHRLACKRRHGEIKQLRQRIVIDDQ